MAKRSRRRNSSHQTASQPRSTEAASIHGSQGPASPQPPPSPSPTYDMGRSPSPGPPPVQSWYQWAHQVPQPSPLPPPPRAPMLGTFPIPSPTYSYCAPRSMPPASSVPSRPPSPAASFAPSRPPSPSRSVISFATEDSYDDSGVAVDARSKASVVTSISIPASAVSPRGPPPVQASTSSSSQSVRAKPPRRLSSLSNLSPKPKRHSQFYFSDDLVTLNVSIVPNVLLANLIVLLSRSMAVFLGSTGRSSNGTRHTSASCSQKRLDGVSRTRPPSSCTR